MSYDSARGKEWHTGVPRSTRSQTLFGYSVLVFAVLGFGYWANTAPIAGATVAAGVFVTTGQNKIIQHLEGGVIKEILVHEGDIVQPEQILIRLDDTSPKAELLRLTLRQARQLAVEARLSAEISETDSEIVFSDELLAKVDDPDIAMILQTQRITFEARRNNMQNEIATFRDSISAFEERIEGTKLQLSAVRRQIKLLEEEIEVKSALLKDGLIRKSELLTLQRAHANLEGEAGRLSGEIGNIREQIARAREQIRTVRSASVKTAADQLHEVRAELNDLRERIHAARRILFRINITSPVKGVVVKMKYHTSGGVVEAGKQILEIVPLQDDLIIEARIRPQDIENVKRGQLANVRLTALNRRIVPMISGEVIYVSADALSVDKVGQQVTGDSYIARIKLNPEEVANVPEFHPTPGMPSEVYIMTVERTFLNYLLRPLKDTMSRAFRES
jgi:HlyD family type I secretion membrane fusion protein